MKITKIFEPIASAISAALVISVLAYLTLETSAGIWLMFSFGATVFIVFVLPKLETAQPKNIFFGHLVSITVGIIFNETIGLSFYSLGLAIPFILSGLLIQKFIGVSDKLKSRMKLIINISGYLLLVTGVLILTNQLQALGFYLIEYFPILQKLG